MQRTRIAAAVAFVTLFVPAGCTTEAAASGRLDTRLALRQPDDQSVTQGGSTPLTITIDRTGFADAVQVGFSNLPRGVTIEPGAIPPGRSSRDLMIVAAPDAPVVERRIVTVHARGQGIDVSQTFELTVEPR